MLTTCPFDKILSLTLRWSSVPIYHICTACWEISICPLTSWCKTCTVLIFWFLPLFHWH